MTITIPSDKLAIFAQAIRTRESGDRPGPQDDARSYGTVNSLGYLGAYQLGLARLCDLGLTERIEGTCGYSNRAFRWLGDWTQARFLADHDVQDRCFMEHVRMLLVWIESRNLHRYVGEQVSALVDGDLAPAADSVVSLSGMVAVAHLLGPGGLRDLLLMARNGADGYLTRASDYMHEFEGLF